VDGSHQRTHSPVELQFLPYLVPIQPVEATEFWIWPKVNRTTWAATHTLGLPCKVHEYIHACHVELAPSSSSPLPMQYTAPNVTRHRNPVQSAHHVATGGCSNSSDGEEYL
jgi:hypothetical protein